MKNFHMPFIQIHQSLHTAETQIFNGNPGSTKTWNLGHSEPASRGFLSALWVFLSTQVQVSVLCSRVRLKGLLTNHEPQKRPYHSKPKTGFRFRFLELIVRWVWSQGPCRWGWWRASEKVSLGDTYWQGLGSFPARGVVVFVSGPLGLCTVAHLWSWQALI